jgi:hypothetical protein
MSDKIGVRKEQRKIGKQVKERKRGKMINVSFVMYRF